VYGAIVVDRHHAEKPSPTIETSLAQSAREVDPRPAAQTPTAAAMIRSVAILVLLGVIGAVLLLRYRGLQGDSRESL
jgi:hypothetical protein